MSTLLLFTILVCVIAAIVLVVHLIERVREVEKHARLAALEAGGNLTTDLRFGQLAGEELWQALTGDQADDIDPEAIDAMRQDYEPVLQRHIEELFEEGVLDGRQGVKLQPRAVRPIKTSGGQVASWLPALAAREVYEVGVARGEGGTVALAALRARLDGACEHLYRSLGLEAPRDYSDVLLPEPPAAANDAPDAAGETAAAAENVAGEPLALAPPEAGETVPPVVVTEGDAVRTGT